MGKKKWFKEFLADKYVKDAKREGFRSRAAFKLLQIDHEFRFFNKCSNVLDLGCAPGSWLQVARRKIDSKKPVIIGVDKLPFKLIEGIIPIKGDFSEESARKRICGAFEGRKIDVILSDMAPNLSGIKVVDSENISKLVNLVLEFSLQNLQQNGWVVIKAFETGTNALKFREDLARYFEKVWLRKPMASKKVSSERFLVAKTLK